MSEPGERTRSFIIDRNDNTGGAAYVSAANEAGLPVEFIPSDDKVGRDRAAQGAYELRMWERVGGYLLGGDDNQSLVVVMNTPPPFTVLTGSPDERATVAHYSGWAAIEKGILAPVANIHRYARDRLHVLVDHIMDPEVMSRDYFSRLRGVVHRADVETTTELLAGLMRDVLRADALRSFKPDKLFAIERPEFRARRVIAGINAYLAGPSPA